MQGAKLLDLLGQVRQVGLQSNRRAGAHRLPEQPKALAFDSLQVGGPLCQAEPEEVRARVADVVVVVEVRRRGDEHVDAAGLDAVGVVEVGQRLHGGARHRLVLGQPALEPDDIVPHFLQLASDDVEDVGVVDVRLARTGARAEARLIGVVGKAHHHGTEGNVQQVLQPVGPHPPPSPAGRGSRGDEIQACQHLPFDGITEKRRSAAEPRRAC